MKQCMKWFELLHVRVTSTFAHLSYKPTPILTHHNVQCVLKLTLYILSMFNFQSGRTPLIAACEGGHSATAQLLIEKGADLSKQGNVRN